MRTTTRRPATDAPPSSCSRYEVLRRIGAGGMAEVFLARRRGEAEANVVLKRIWPEHARDPAFVAMFTDEARLSLRLVHPNVVRTLEVGEEDGQLFIAMERLEGHSLRQVIDRLRADGGLPLPLHLFVLAEVLAALQHAHTLTEGGAYLEVVHRDVSPQNVFLTYDGAVKLMDFGVAKSTAATHQTQAGVIKGRLAYMAPEQIRGGRVDRRADLFGVGVMLWEAIAGRRLWEGLAEAQIVQRLISGEPLPPPPPCAEAPEALSWICARALALDPDVRYTSAAQLRAELRELFGPQLQADEAGPRLARALALAFPAERQASLLRHESPAGGASDLLEDRPTASASTVPPVSALSSIRTAAPLRATRRASTRALAAAGLLAALAFGGGRLYGERTAQDGGPAGAPAGRSIAQKRPNGRLDAAATTTTPAGLAATRPPAATTTPAPRGAPMNRAPSTAAPEATRALAADAGTSGAAERASAAPVEASEAARAERGRPARRRTRMSGAEAVGLAWAPARRARPPRPIDVVIPYAR